MTNAHGPNGSAYDFLANKIKHLEDKQRDEGAEMIARVRELTDLLLSHSKQLTGEVVQLFEAIGVIQGKAEETHALIKHLQVSVLSTFRKEVRCEIERQADEALAVAQPKPRKRRAK